MTQARIVSNSSTCLNNGEIDVQIATLTAILYNQNDQISEAVSIIKE